MTLRSEIFFLIGVVVGAAGVVMVQLVDRKAADPVAAFQRYDDPPIILPIEAFGATWRIQQFRKNVRFPSNGFDDAMDRAFAAAVLLRPLTDAVVEISLRPVTYRMTRPIMFRKGMGAVNINGHGALLTNVGGVDMPPAISE